MFDSKIKTYDLSENTHSMIRTDYDKKEYFAEVVYNPDEMLLDDYTLELERANLHLNTQPYHYAFFEHAILITEYMFEHHGLVVKKVNEGMARVVEKHRKISIPSEAIETVSIESYNDEYHYLIPIMANLLIKGKYGSRTKKINNLKFHRYYHLCLNRTNLNFKEFQRQLLDYVNIYYKNFYKSIEDSLIVINSTEEAKNVIQRELSSRIILGAHK